MAHITEAIKNYELATDEPFFITLYFLSVTNLGDNWLFPVFGTYDAGQEYFLSYASKVNPGQSISDVVAKEMRTITDKQQFEIDHVAITDSALTRDGTRLLRLGVHVFVPGDIRVQSKADFKWLPYVSDKLNTIDSMQYVVAQSRYLVAEFRQRGLVLDGTPATVSALEEGFRLIIDPKLAEPYWIQSFGSYLAHLMHIYFESEWVRDVKNQSWRFFLKSNDGNNMITSPYNKVAKRILNGEEDDLGFYFLAIQNMAKERITPLTIPRN